MSLRICRGKSENKEQSFSNISDLWADYLSKLESKTLTFRLRRKLLTRSASFVTTSSTLTTTVTCMTKARGGWSDLCPKPSLPTTGQTRARLWGRSLLWETSPSLPCQASPGRRVFTQWVRRARPRSLVIIFSPGKWTPRGLQCWDPL